MGVGGLGRIHNTGQRLALCVRNNISTFVVEELEAVGADVHLLVLLGLWLCVCVFLGRGLGEIIN